VTILIASQVLSWIALIALGFVCIAMARQIGVLHERVAPAGALAMNQKLRAGDKAPELSAQSLTGELVTVGGVRGDRSQLLFFLAPDCPVCKSLLPALTTAAAAERSWIDVVLLSDGEGPQHERYVHEQGLGKFPYVVSELIGRSYGVSKLPYAVVIDEQGHIASMGLVNSREHLDSLFEAKERGVASIQDFLARRAS
jgi:methylamine dehydrogenase accessory protein MauD